MSNEKAQVVLAEDSSSQRKFEVVNAELIFLGSGSSGGTPSLDCLRKTFTDETTCTACPNSLLAGSKNRRGNPSFLLRFKERQNARTPQETDGHQPEAQKVVLFDCGKTFKTSMIASMMKHKISHLDAVVLSHGHADAYFGMDDLREFTKKEKMPIYLDKKTFKSVASTFPYLIDNQKATGSGYVSRLDFVLFEEKKPFSLFGIEIFPFLVDHGINSQSNGFIFSNVVIISDLSALPTPSLEFVLSTSSSFLQERKRQTKETSHKGDDGAVKQDNILDEISDKPEEGIDLLIIDALRETESNISHMSLINSIKEAQKMKAKEVYFVGMSHEIDYYKVNPILTNRLDYATDLTNGQLAYDGLSISFPLTLFTETKAQEISEKKEESIIKST